MPTELSLAAHLEGVRAAVTSFVAYADKAGLDAKVPTCPDWTVRQLVAHQGMVHRWATATLQGTESDADAFEREGLTVGDPLAWLDDGAERLVAAIGSAPDDVRSVVFLNDAPAPRVFWARRQCHETSVHAVDALSAVLDRYPRAEETWIDPLVALDGVDELLMGFLTRNTSRLRSAEPVVIAVLPDDVEGAAPRSWRVTVSARPAVTTRLPGREAAEGADVVLEGPAPALYLTLWNRSDELAAHEAVALFWEAGINGR